MSQGGLQFRTIRSWSPDHFDQSRQISLVGRGRGTERGHIAVGCGHLDVGQAGIEAGELCLPASLSTRRQADRLDLESGHVEGLARSAVQASQNADGSDDQAGREHPREGPLEPAVVSATGRADGLVLAEHIPADPGDPLRIRSERPLELLRELGRKVILSGPLGDGGRVSVRWMSILGAALHAAILEDGRRPITRESAGPSRAIAFRTDRRTSSGVLSGSSKTSALRNSARLLTTGRV